MLNYNEDPDKCSINDCRRIENSKSRWALNSTSKNNTGNFRMKAFKLSFEHYHSLLPRTCKCITSALWCPLQHKLKLQNGFWLTQWCEFPQKILLKDHEINYSVSIRRKRLLSAAMVKKKEMYPSVNATPHSKDHFFFLNSKEERKQR